MGCMGCRRPFYLLNSQGQGLRYDFPGLLQGLDASWGVSGTSAFEPIMGFLQKQYHGYRFGGVRILPCP
jgi:hypothetical protein